MLAAEERANASERARVKDPLAMQQQIVRDRLTQLEDRMFRLAEKLSPSEPDQAKRLQQALQQARELLIRRNMDETIALLERAELAPAAERQAAIAEALEQVLKILLAEPQRAKEIQEQIDRLRALQDRVAALLKEQHQLKAQTDATIGPASRPAKPPPSLDQMQLAHLQRALQKQAEKLARDMGTGCQQDNDKPASQPSGDRQRGKEPASQASPAPTTPGAQNVQRSSEHMSDAGNDLENRAPREAGQNQDKAIDELEQARRALQQSLDQLRQEQQQEALRGLEGRFRDMLSRQSALNQSTQVVDAKGRQNWTHADELTLAGLARDQTSLADQAAEALKIIEEDGTSIVFPELVRQLKEDMLEVARRLTGKEPGSTTRQIQGEIAATLEELIEATRQVPAPGGSAAGNGSGGGGRAPLLPESAELKMLRAGQQRVNRRTQEFQAVHGDPAKRSAVEQRDLQRITDRQRELAEMARKMNERLTRQ